VDVYRTPDERFSGLPDFPYEPAYREIAGLRLAVVDEGDGEAVVFFHGEPTWSYLWRTIIPPVLAAGFRCVAPDYAGFGRSDKPTDDAWYTYDRHVDLMAELLGGLDIRDAIAVVHDWGGPIGLRLAVEHPDWFSRLVIMETAPFTGRQTMSDDWMRFRDFVARTEDLPIGLLVRRGCFTDPGDEVASAYDAPFPTVESKAGARAFPAILPTTPDAPGAATGRAVASALAADQRPGLVLWGGDDPILPPALGERVAAALGYPPPTIISDASHFLQEDAGAEIGGIIVEWLASG
jgi:haloalkane dehalogenase